MALGRLHETIPFHKSEIVYFLLYSLRTSTTFVDCVAHHHVGRRIFLFRLGAPSLVHIARQVHMTSALGREGRS